MIRLNNNKLIRLQKISNVFLLLILFCSCSVSKLVPEGQEIYKGAKLKITSTEKVDNKKILTEELYEFIRPKPNSEMFGVFMPRLWMHYKAESLKETKFNSWFKSKASEQPVLFNDLAPPNTQLSLQNHLYNKGFFTTEIEYSLKRKKKFVFVEYDIKLNTPYLINEIYFPQGEDDVNEIIRYSKVKSLLFPGQRFDLEIMKQERERIELHMQEEQFYYFSSDFLIFKIDSSIGNHKVNVYISLKENIPDKLTRRYYIRNIYINASYMLREESVSIDSYNQIDSSGYYFFDRFNAFKPEIITNAISFKPYRSYRRQKHDYTINHLMGLGTFKFVNLDFAEVNSDTAFIESQLDLFIYLTPLQQHSVRLELSAVTKSNNFVGPGFNVSFKNRNFFKGAELYVFKLNSGFETQIIGQENPLSSYLFGIENEIYIPRFFTPFGVSEPAGRFIPRTKIKLGYQFLDRVSFYRLNSFDATYGFIWNENERKKHEFNPIVINYVDLSQQSDRFTELLQQNPILRKSFEQQFIPGLNYNYVYNNQVSPQVRNPIYFSGKVDLAGNLFFLTQRVIKGKPDNRENSFKLFNLEYSQFSRIETDFRFFPKITRKSKLAYRFIAGLGIPYLNSSILPYAKQFFIGGPNSIRGFLPRSIGPGIYNSPNKASGDLFVDQTGDIKIESNIEYRFDISSVFKGALFLDAGNIWLRQENINTSGGKFNFSDFYNEVAASSGLGLRLDLSFFVIRLDWAIPIRKPYFPEGNRWVLKEINFGDINWRKENLVLNIAIGYPF